MCLTLCLAKFGDEDHLVHNVEVTYDSEKITEAKLDGDRQSLCSVDPFIMERTIAHCLACQVLSNALTTN